PQRIRILASLAEGRNYVSQLARDVELGRPLVHMHLQRLEAAGLVKGQLELSEDGRAMKYFEIVSFRVEVTPAAVVAAAARLGSDR
ncbi:MAG TPA: winged helix-turn-helix domain-containing protein, partial [Acidimicrobiales bacterium]|nr:winged helix-turn-helix domain-containing protein [Acidimicrobiales bacterium]